MQPFRPTRATLQAFDSGKLAPRVGSVILPDGATITEGEAQHLIEMAADDDLDLVWIESQVRLETRSLEYRGTLVELLGDRDEALSKLPPAVSQFSYRTLDSDSDQKAFETLLTFVAITRFTTDPRISPAAFLEHKRALLKAHVANRQGIIMIAHPPGDRDRPVGYTCTSLSEARAQVYDLCTDAEFQRSSVARSLLRASIERYAALHPDVLHYLARIYEDNIPCLRLMRSIGFADTGKLFHYYHCWPKVRH